MTTRRRKAVVALVTGDVAVTVIARVLGYGVGRNAIVRCRRGHLFTTLWLPLVSVKSLRLGWWRIQRCPVGRHWSIVTPVKESSLTASQRRAARSRHDLRLP